IDQYFRFNVLDRASVCADTHSANSVAVQKRRDGLCLHHRDTARRGAREKHVVKITPPHRPCMHIEKTRLRMPSFDRNPKGIFSPRPIDRDAVLHRMPPRSHFFLEAESSQAITGLAGEGFADVVTRRLCFLDYRYAQAGVREEHGSGASAGPATNNRDIGFHPIPLLRTTSGRDWFHLTSWELSAEKLIFP